MKKEVRLICFLFSLIITTFITGCLSTTDTARVKKGFSHAGTFEVTRIDHDEGTPFWQDYTYTHSAFNYRPSYGFLFGENFGIEAGLKIGLFTQGVIGAEAKSDNSGNWQLKYYPIDSYFSKGLKNYFKFGFFQSSPIKAAVITEFAGIRPAVLGLIVSKEGKKVTPYFSLKTFDRFISSAEKSMAEDNWGQIFTAGIELKTNRKFIFTKKKINFLVELGFLNNYWYDDKLSQILGFGFTLR